MFLTLSKTEMVNKGNVSSLLYLPCKVFVLTCMRMALEQAKTCSKHVK